MTVSDAGRLSLQGIEQIGEGFGVSGCAFSRQAGRRLDQNVNVLNQIVGRIRCPVSLLTSSRHRGRRDGWGSET